jgi:hypothetical protein
LYYENTIELNVYNRFTLVGKKWISQDDHGK